MMEHMCPLIELHKREPHVPQNEMSKDRTLVLKRRVYNMEPPVPQNEGSQDRTLVPKSETNLLPRNGALQEGTTCAQK